MDLPVKSLSPEDRQRLALQMYALLGKQVKSYHKYHHMGDNSSVPTELARDLMASMEYTIEGISASGDLEQTLRTGQAILEGKRRKAGSVLGLVRATAPQWQTECRHDALVCLERYLAGYDHLHLAHKIPEDLFYPFPVAVPETLRGVDQCLFVLNLLWLENQIMVSFGEEALEEFWDRLPADTLNQCEQLVINGLGKALLGRDGLSLTEEEIAELTDLLRGEPELQELLEAAAARFCRRQGLTENCAAYVRVLIPQLAARLSGGNLNGIFV